MTAQHKLRKMRFLTRRSKNLGKFLRGEKGITGLETAIILIAFVVVASVFAYTVLVGGIYSSNRSKQSIQEGIDSLIALRPQGEPIGYATEIDIDDCEDNWSGEGSSGATGTPSLDSSTLKEGDYSVSIVCGGTWSAANDLLASESTSVLNLTTAAKIRAWIYVSEAISEGDLEIVLYDTIASLDKEEQLDIPELTATTWTRVELTLDAPTDCDSIDGVGLEAEADPGTMTVKLDDIEIIPYVQRVRIAVTNGLKGWSVDLTPPYEVQTGSHNELSATNEEGATIISYSDDNVSVSQCSWTVEFLGYHSDDYVLEEDETAAITVWLVNCQWDSTNSTLYYSLGSSETDRFISDADNLLGPKQEFKIEITPPAGATYPVERTTPASIISVMYLKS